MCKFRKKWAVSTGKWHVSVSMWDIPQSMAIQGKRWWTTAFWCTLVLDKPMYVCAYAYNHIIPLSLRAFVCGGSKITHLLGMTTVQRYPYQSLISEALSITGWHYCSFPCLLCFFTEGRTLDSRRWTIKAGYKYRKIWWNCDDCETSHFILWAMKEYCPGKPWFGGPFDGRVF